MKVYQLYVKMPPLSIAELFGAEPEPAANGGEWEDIPPVLLQKKNSILFKNQMDEEEKDLEENLD